LLASRPQKLEHLVVGVVLQAIVTFLRLGRGTPVALLVVEEQIPFFEEAAQKPHLLSYGARKEESEFLPILFGEVLNMAEIELSVLVRQCLKRRIPDTKALRREVKAWQK
jgi:hypothetical protein